MPKVKSGWKKLHTSTKKGALAHYYEKITYGSGVVTDCILSEFGPYYADPKNGSNPNIPCPPPGVDWTVMFIQNNTMSTAGDIVLQGAETTGGTFATLKDDLVAYAASAGGDTATAATYTQQPGLTPSGGRTPVMRFFEDDDGLHSTSTGTDKTAEVHLYWIIP